MEEEVFLSWTEGGVILNGLPVSYNIMCTCWRLSSIYYVDVGPYIKVQSYVSILKMADS